MDSSRRLETSCIPGGTMRDKSIPAEPGAPRATFAGFSARLRSREWAPRRRLAESGGRGPLAEDRVVPGSSYLSLLHIYTAICRRSRLRKDDMEIAEMASVASSSRKSLLERN